MKTMKKHFAILALSGVMLSCGDSKKEASTEKDLEETPTATMPTEDAESTRTMEASFKDDSSKQVFDHYQKMRSALVASNLEATKSAATELASRLSEDHAELKSMAMKIADASDLEAQRQLFSDLTEQVEPMLKESITEGQIYKQYCPMAFKGQGGFWLSNAEEIRNPYYGDKMLTCGKVMEVIQ